MSALATVAPEEGPRSKRGAILAAASRQFGEDGYDATKWSKIADEVGIGQTALYHYFESKAHCLFTIMRLQLEHSFATLQEVVASEEDALTAVETALRRVYDVTRDDVLRLRVLHSNMALLATPRSSAREEAERQAARGLIRDFEQAWAALLERAMDAGQIERQDARQLARLVLGLAVSVWSWFNPKGTLSIQEVGAFTTQCCVRLLGPRTRSRRRRGA